MDKFSLFLEAMAINVSPDIKLKIINNRTTKEYVVKVYRLIDKKWKTKDEESYYTNDLNDAQMTMIDMGKRLK